MQLYLIRHPAPLVAAGVCYGGSDLPLAGDVVAAAKRIAAQLPPRIATYTSPLQRCRQLAQALHPAPIEEARLREMDFGSWEMRPWDGIDRLALDAWADDPLGYAPPGGESVASVRQRTLGFLNDLRAMDAQCAAMVTHAGIMKVIFGHVQGMDPAQWMALKFDYECVIRVNYADA